MFKKIRAFSLVELMMILLVASLIIAALVPVVTKKHFRLPSLVNHGAYMCYYENGKLKEAKWAGKFQQQPIFNRETDNCVFIPPKKAAYFQISAIGGGGGGGDAGYRGGSWKSYPASENTISPFGITKENLINMMDLDNLPDAEIDYYINDWKQYVGKLMGYANGLDSGAGGKIGYIDSSDSQDCKTYKFKTEYVYCDKTYTFDSFDGKNCKYVANCDSVEVCKEKEIEKYYDSDECVDWGSPYDCTGSHTESYDCQTSKVPCWKSECGSGGAGGTGGTDAAGGCGGYMDTCDGPTTCKTREVKNSPTQYCTDCAKYETRRHYYTDTEKYDCKTETINCESITTEGATEADCTGVATVSEKCGTNTVNLGCEEWYPYVCKYMHHYEYGGAGGKGASCQSSSITGGLNVKQTVYATGGSPVDGATINQGSKNSCYGAGQAPQGKAVCADGSLQTSCASPSYATTTITKGSESVTATATGATSGGTGGSILSTKTNKCNVCVDDSTSSGTKGTDGSCTAGSVASDCSGSGDYGYCLAHVYDPTTWEPGGMYEFYYGYDQNYLQSGNAGDPGQFKTTIVRSLKNVDLTIKVGRGGSAAAYNSGGSGASGSTSSLGAIISASGGSGGSGSQIGETRTLPTYRKARYEKESLCYYYDKYLSKNPDGSYKYTDAQAKKLQDKITNSNPNGAAKYCEGLINNQNGYQYFMLGSRLGGGAKTGAYPTPVGVFSTFMNIAFSNASSSDLFNRFMKFGRGGTGGDVEHRCWAGRHDVVFEKQTLKASVFVDQATAKAHNVDDDSKYVPDGCRNDYSNIPASPGVDGAILIKW